MSELNKKLMELDEEQVAQLYKNVFNTPEGQLVLEDLKNRCFIKTSTYHHSMNPQEIAWNEGMRNVVLHISSQINYEPLKQEGSE